MRMELLLIQWLDKKEFDMKALPTEIPTINNLLFIWTSLSEETTLDGVEWSVQIQLSTQCPYASWTLEC